MFRTYKQDNQTLRKENEQHKRNEYYMGILLHDLTHLIEKLSTHLDHVKISEAKKERGSKNSSLSLIEENITSIRNLTIFTMKMMRYEADDKERIVNLKSLMDPIVSYYQTRLRSMNVCFEYQIIGEDFSVFVNEAKLRALIMEVIEDYSELVATEYALKKERIIDVELSSDNENIKLKMGIPRGKNNRSFRTDFLPKSNYYTQRSNSKQYHFISLPVNKL